MKKSFFLCLGGFLLFLNLSSKQKPNIILFLVDDMGLMDTSVPMLTNKEGKPQKHPLNDWYRTPNMERLAKPGVRFSPFYAHSGSSRTRASLMTGQNSARHRVTQFISPESKNAGPEDWKWEGLTSKDTTLPSILRSNGYHTIFAGKAHFAPIGHEGEDPTKLGFDINIAGCSFGAPGSYFGEDGYGILDPKRKKGRFRGWRNIIRLTPFSPKRSLWRPRMPSPFRFKKTSPSFCTCPITQYTVLSRAIRGLSKIMKTRKSQDPRSHLPL